MSRAEGGGRREGGCRWLGRWSGQRGGETPRAPPGSTSRGSEQTRHKGGSRRSCQSAALPVTGVAPPPPPPPPPPQSPALPGPVCLGPVVQRGRWQRRRRRDEARTAPARSRPRPAPPLAPGLAEADSWALALRLSPRATESRAGLAARDGRQWPFSLTLTYLLDGHAWDLCA